MRDILLAAALCAAASPAFAQAAEGAEPRTVLDRIGATLTLRAGVWSSTHELDGAGPLTAAMLWGKVTKSASERVSFFAEGWTSVRGPFADGKARAELREASATYASGPLEVRAGRQIIAWGRADGINPTDNLTGRDQTLLAPDDSDRRLGASAVRVTYSHRDISVTGIWLPEFRPHRLPLPQFAGDVTAAGSEWRPDQFALRVEQTGRAIDWSVSAFNGRDLNPDLGLSESRLQLTHHTLRVVGADAAGNVGRFGLRAEAAFVDTEDNDGRDPFIKNPFLWIVAGGDRTYREHLNVNVQYLYRFVARFRGFAVSDSPLIDLVANQEATLNSQTRRHQHGASARVSYKWLHDTLEAEVAAAGDARPRGIALRPKITYAVSDRMKLLVGGEFYRGSASSLFGVLKDNSGGFLEARWSF